MIATIIFLVSIAGLVSIGYLVLRGRLLSEYETWQRARAEKQNRQSRDLQMQVKRDEAIAYVLSEMQRQDMPHKKAA